MFIVGMFIRAAIIYYLSKFVVFLFRAMYEHGYQFSYAVKNFYLTAYFFYILLNQQDYCVLLQQAPERSPRKPQSAAHASPRAQRDYCGYLQIITSFCNLSRDYGKMQAIYNKMVANQICAKRRNFN